MAKSDSHWIEHAQLEKGSDKLPLPPAPGSHMAELAGLVDGLGARRRQFRWR